MFEHGKRRMKIRKLKNLSITFVTSHSPNYHFVKNLFVISQNQRGGIEISYDDDFAIFLH